jgi:hypothetical protein
VLVPAEAADLVAVLVAALLTAALFVVTFLAAVADLLDLRKIPNLS